MVQALIKEMTKYHCQVVWKQMWMSRRLQLLVVFGRHLCDRTSIKLFAGLSVYTTAIQRFSERLRRAIAEKINSLPLGYFDGALSGGTLSRVTNDVDTAAQSLNQSLEQFFHLVYWSLAVLVTMFGMNWILALVTVVSTPYRFLLSCPCFMGKSRASFKESA